MHLRNLEVFLLTDLLDFLICSTVLCNAIKRLLTVVRRIAITIELTQRGEIHTWDHEVVLMVVELVL
jgi:hypothetical protein